MLSLIMAVEDGAAAGGDSWLIMADTGSGDDAVVKVPSGHRIRLKRGELWGSFVGGMGGNVIIHFKFYGFISGT